MKKFIFLLIVTFLVSCTKPDLSLTSKKSDLKNASPEELNQIIQDKLDEINTPTTKYPFFKQLEGWWNLDEIIKAWWMEITHWEVYQIWFSKDYVFLNKIINEIEKRYSFNKNNNNLYYTDDDANTFYKKISWLFSNIKIINNTAQNLNLEWFYNNKKYIIDFSVKNWSSREQLDDVLWTSNKNKATFSTLN